MDEEKITTQEYLFLCEEIRQLGFDPSALASVGTGARED